MRTQSGNLIALATTLVFAMACASSEGTGGGEGEGEEVEETQNVCGDSVCAASEVGYCTQDCGMGGNNSGPICGNGTCDTGESNASCAADCPADNGTGGGGGGGGGGSCDPIACLLCLLDGSTCAALGTSQATCSTCEYCDGGAPDGTCDPATEDFLVCPSDCQ
jgi:hypothetical protein